MEQPEPSTCCENLKAGYETAVALWTYEGNLLWSKFSAMLVANSIAVGIIGLSLGAHGARSLAVGMSALGLILCILWYALMVMGFDNHKYWIWCARELEVRLGGLVTVTRGGDFAEGKTVRFLVGTPKPELRPRIHRLLTAARAAELVIAVFIALYLLLLVFALLPA